MAKNAIALLTGGGDAPGLNGVIESCGKSLLKSGYRVIGICDGFEGIFNGRTLEITEQMLEGRHSEAGTLLGTTNKCGTTGREAEFLQKYEKLGVSGIVACGGDGTFSGFKPFKGKIPMIGIPKTIDNDISGTEVSFGFDTACSVVAHAVDALRASAHAHSRIILVETMGRTAGWIALGGGLASYADVILIPERPFDKKNLIRFIKDQHLSGKRGLMISIAEGAHGVGESMKVAFEVKNSPQKERLGGIAAVTAKWIEDETGWEARNVVLGHLQRSEHPTTFDRFLTLSMGVEAAQMVVEGAWNQAVAYRQGQVVRTHIEDLMGPPRLVDPHHKWVSMAESLGIYI